MKRSGPNRRRAMVIMAGTTAAMAIGTTAAPAERHIWRGTALGAEGQLIFHGIERDKAARLVTRSVAEIERLEQVFSLYRPDSELSRLNSSGKLAQPSHDLRSVLSAALGLWHTTGGAFNPALQPLLKLVSGRFREEAGAPDPDAEMLLKTLASCDPAQIALSGGKISLQPGMAINLNGIAQGYITDRVSELLRSEGLRNILVQLGETRALPGRAWQLALAGAEEKLTLRERAVAVSAGNGNLFTKDGRWHHLLDPRTGRSPQGFRQVVVVAPKAMDADGLSTALAVADAQKLPHILRRFPQARVRVQSRGGTWLDPVGRRRET